MSDAFAQRDVARAVATIAHRGQTDKAGRPYIEHPAAVAASFEGRDDSIDLQAIAWLHDVLEDTDLNAQDLRNAGIGRSIVEDVERLTHWDGESDQDYYERVRKSERARRVKIADVMHNSDPSRLALLDPGTQARLTEKYARALSALMT